MYIDDEGNVIKDQIDDTTVDQAEDDVDISFEDENTDSDNDDSEQPSATESSTITELRKQLRLKEKRLAELDKAKPEEELVLGAEPNLDDPEIDYDADKFKAALKKHYETAAEIERRKNAKQDAANNKSTSANEATKLYESQVKALGVANHKKYEDQFLADTKGFEGTASVILKAAKDKALIVYVLGKNPAKLDSLLDITDNIELAAEVARIERSVKVQKKQSEIKPEQTVRGSASGASQSSSKHTAMLAKLEKEAERTGNRTPIINYKREHKL